MPLRFYMTLYSTEVKWCLLSDTVNEEVADFGLICKQRPLCLGGRLLSLSLRMLHLSVTSSLSPHMQILKNTVLLWALYVCNMLHIQQNATATKITS